MTNDFRLPQEIYQTAKLASYLLKSQTKSGKVQFETDQHLEAVLSSEEESDTENTVECSEKNGLDGEVQVDSGRYRLKS